MNLFISIMNLDVLIWPENLLETNLSPANYHRFLCDKIHTFCLFYLMRHLRHEVPVKMSRIQVVRCDPDVVVIDKPASVPVSQQPKAAQSARLHLQCSML